MALYVPGSDGLVKTTGVINYNSPYTMMAWIYYTADRNDYTHMFAISAAGLTAWQNSDYVGTSNDGTTFRLDSCIGGSSGASIGTNLSINTWYHIAVVRSSTTALDAYLNGVHDIGPITTNVTARSAAGYQYVGIFTTKPMQGNIAYYKEFATALTADEIKSEMYSVIPLSAQIRSWTPFHWGASERLIDYSGNGYNWTATGGGITDADSPPIGYGSRYFNIPSIVEAVESLTVADASCTSQVDTPTLTQVHNLIVNDASCTSQADNVTVTPDIITLVVADCSSTSQTDAVTVTQVHNLILADAFCTSQTDAVSITQVHNLALADAFCTSQTDAISITQAHNLTLADAFCTSQSDNVTLTQLHNLVLADAFCITQVDTVTLTEYIHLSPATDSYVGNWTNELDQSTNLYESVNEDLTANDSDYIQSEQTPSSRPVVLALESGNDPLGSDGHVLRYRYAVDGAGTINLVVQLRQGYTNEGSPGTLIAEWTHNGIGAITTAEQTLSGAQADSITNYSSLFVRMVATEV